MPSTSPKWLEKVKEFRAALEKHIREEEDTLFPELRAQLSEEKNKALTHAMNKEGFKVA
jgi:hemerythrin-like domain-containing protein